MGSRPRNKKSGGSWSDSRIDSSKPFNLKFYPNATTMDRWKESSISGSLSIPISKNSFSVEVMCHEQGRGSRSYLGCYYPAVDGSRYGKDSGKGYSNPELIFTLRNDKGQNVGYSNQTYHKGRIENTFHLFNPQAIIQSYWAWNDIVDENKLGNDGKVYGKAFVALFPALPDIPQVHHSIYETQSAESVHRRYFTEYDESKYLSQQDGRLASNIVSFQIQVRMPTPTITVKKKRLKVIM